MARKVTVASKAYGVGTTEIVVDNFPPVTKNVKITVTREGWPETLDVPVIKLTLLWSNGQGASDSYGGGTLLNRSGVVALTNSLSVDVPEQNDGQGGSVRKTVVDCKAIIEILKPLTTAITVEAF